MKNYYFFFLAVILLQSCIASESIFELSPAQSMSITGLGVGQDAAINPYSETTSLSIIKNIGDNNFIIRIQENGNLIKMIDIKPNETKEVILLKGYELYLDSNLKSKAQVKFKKYED